MNEHMDEKLEDFMRGYEGFRTIQDFEDFANHFEIPLLMDPPPPNAKSAAEAFTINLLCFERDEKRVREAMEQNVAVCA